MILPEISGRLTEEQMGRLMGQLKEIEGCLDFSVNLKPIERRTKRKQGTVRLRKTSADVRPSTIFHRLRRTLRLISK